MKIEVKLYANFREYLPSGSDAVTCHLEIKEGARVGEVLQRLKIPDSEPLIALVNGLHKGPEEVLNPGDVLSVFPPVAGG